MEMQYFKSAWGDIKNSPGWFGKLCLLALLNLVPVFGQIVTFAYLYGWAREIAWGTHEPMPAKIIDNGDGKFWRRGWFALVLAFVFGLVAVIIMSVGSSWQSLGFTYSRFGVQTIGNPWLVGLGGVLYWIGVACAILLAVLGWIGTMRISIYDRLSSGFQFGKIWKMLRHDTSGILKILGMDLLFGFIFGLILTVVYTVLALIVASVGVAALVNAGYFISPSQLQYLTQAEQAQMLVHFLGAAGAVGFFALLVGTYLTFLASTFVNMLVFRAMGYWTMQFDVPHWGGQDDPMPFEVAGNGRPHQQAQAQPAAQPQSQPQPVAQAQPQSQQPVQAVAPIVAPIPAAPGEPDEEMPEIDYGAPIEVGAGFILTPEEIAEAEAAAVTDSVVSETASEADAQGAHGVQDGQASDAHVGEDGEPHGGEPEGGQA